MILRTGVDSYHELDDYIITERMSLRCYIYPFKPGIHLLPSPFIQQNRKTTSSYLLPAPGIPSAGGGGGGPARAGGGGGPGGGAPAPAGAPAGGGRPPGGGGAPSSRGGGTRRGGGRGPPGGGGIGAAWGGEEMGGGFFRFCCMNGLDNRCISGLKGYI